MSSRMTREGAAVSCVDSGPAMGADHIDAVGAVQLIDGAGDNGTGLRTTSSHREGGPGSGARPLRTSARVTRFPITSGRDHDHWLSEFARLPGRLGGSPNPYSIEQLNGAVVSVPATG